MRWASRAPPCSSLTSTGGMENQPSPRTRLAPWSQLRRLHAPTPLLRIPSQCPLCIQVSNEFRDVECEEQLLDSFVYKVCRDPSHFDVVVTANMYGM